MAVTALVQVIVSRNTLMMGKDYVFLLTGVLVAIWLMSAPLFRKAARDDTYSG